MSKKMISLFTGAGGLDWGFHNSNEYELVTSNEILKPHLKTYTDNYKIPIVDIESYSDELHVGICGDVHNLIIPHDADVLMGGPPSRF